MASRIEDRTGVWMEDNERLVNELMFAVRDVLAENLVRMRSTRAQAFNLLAQLVLGDEIPAKKITFEKVIESEDEYEQ